MDEKNRLLLNAECHNKKDNLYFFFHFFRNFENVTFKIIYIYTWKKMVLIWHLEDRASWYILIKNQIFALFLSFISIKYSTCFGQTYCLSSGFVTLYSPILFHFHIASCLFFAYFVIRYCCVGFIQFFFSVFILICLFFCWAMTNLTNINCC